MAGILFGWATHLQLRLLLLQELAGARDGATGTDTCRAWLAGSRRVRGSGGARNGAAGALACRARSAGRMHVRAAAMLEQLQVLHGTGDAWRQQVKRAYWNRAQ